MKTILITGASSGIGMASAKLFSSKGWRVVAVVRSLERASALKTCPNVVCYQMDVSDAEASQNTINQIIKDVGRIDVLLNNAGLYATSPLECMPQDDISQLIDVNLKGTILVTRMLIPHFRKNGSGTVINVSSIAGCATFPYQSVYHSTKWAVEGFSEGLRYELSDLNIKVRLVVPGNVKTNLWKVLDANSADSYPKIYHSSFARWFHYLNKSIESGIEPEEEAAVIYRAATDKGNKLHYTSEPNVKLAMLLHSILPAGLFQRIIRGQIG